MAINSWDVLVTSIIRWQREQFQTCTANSSARHLMQECGELLHAPNDIEEWADAFFIVLQGADRVFQQPSARVGLLRALEPGEVLRLAIEAKFNKNRKRTWSQPDKDGVVTHTSEGQG